MTTGKISKIAGPLVVATGMREANMFDVVRVSDSKLIGEIIEMHGDRASIQVYEETSGLGTGEPVESTGEPLSVELGPGLIEGIFDGIQRPLEKIRELVGNSLVRGVEVPALDRDKKWHFVPKVKPGDKVVGGDILGTVQETEIVEHRIMVKPGVVGTVKSIAEGDYTVTEQIGSIETANGEELPVTLMQKWPVRRGRPFEKKLAPNVPLVTGQRVVDTLFPIAKGGVAAIPGPFGSGKTVTQHQLAKWAEADIVVYIGCGERGNEMTDVLNEFPELIDPHTGKSLMERTVLIANTSDMPVAAREASIYTGITIAEYFRDMGYSVALMADSTSRWAEALREISGRLEEMPAEEGYPAYLPSRLSAFYERAGYVETLSHENASVSIIGAVSPQGNDFSEPVTQNTKRFIRCFWALEKALAYARHYPAVNWTTSYSEYTLELDDWFKANVAHDFPELRTKISNILSEENSLMDIVKLIGSDLLAEEQKLILETARVIRTGFLQQNAMHETDCYVPIRKQYLMMKYILQSHERAKTLVAKSIPVSELRSAGIFDILGRMKYDIPNEDESKFDDMWQKITSLFSDIEKKYDIK